MPGVLILEAMAQVGAVALLSLPENRGKIALFGGVKNARFKRKVTPGDVLEMTCTLTKRRGPVGIGSCMSSVTRLQACMRAVTLVLNFSRLLSFVMKGKRSDRLKSCSSLWALRSISARSSAS